MEDTLKRLLSAEQQASKITRQAEVEADQIVQTALSEARVQQERFEQRLPKIRESHLEKASQRAEQTIKEIEKRFDERIAGFREAAEANEEEALDAAFSYLLRPGVRSKQ